MFKHVLQFCVIILAATFAFTCYDQSNSEGQSCIIPFRGSIKDKNGKPLGGVIVYRFMYDPKSKSAKGEYFSVSEANDPASIGTFSFNHPLRLTSDSEYQKAQFSNTEITKEVKLYFTFEYKNAFDTLPIREIPNLISINPNKKIQDEINLGEITLSF